MKISLFSQFGSFCLLLGSLLNGVQGNEPQRREYIYLSRNATPAGTARMVVDETAFPEQRTEEGTRLAQGYRTRTQDVEILSEMTWDEDRAIRSDEYFEEPVVFGTRTATNLRGWQYGYTSGGRRYSAHCLTAPVCRPVSRPVRPCAPRPKCPPCRPRCPSPYPADLTPGIYEVSPAQPAAIESPGYDTEFAPPQVRSTTRRPSTLRSTGAGTGVGGSLGGNTRYRVTSPRSPQADAYLDPEMPELDLSTPE